MIDIDGYRPNVGIIIINDEKKVLLAKRLNENAWQFPQGGINDKESTEDAMYRELKEEVGLSHDHILVIEKTKGWLRYDVPKNWIRNNSQQKYRGQKQVWFLLKFVGEDTDIFLRPLALRLAKTLRPLAEAIRSRNPCLFLLFLFEGWNVLFIKYKFE